MTNEETQPMEEVEIEVISDEEMQIVTADIKRQQQAKQIGALILAGKTYNEIASELGIHRNTLYALLRNQDMRPLMTAEITSMESIAKEMIDELASSPSSANKRHALSEMTKLIRHSKDKVYPTIFRSENIHAQATVDNKMETALMFEQVVYESIRRLPPDARKAWSRHFSDVKREWNITRSLNLS